MIIVFAGCDCAGKSTCISMFDKHRWEVKKGVANSDFRDSLEVLKEEIEQGLNVIHDRIPLIDDFVYTPIFAKRESMYVSCKDEVSDLLKKCVVIYLDCDNRVLSERMKARGDEYITPDQIPEIKSRYENVLQKLGVSPHKIDTTMKNPEEVFAEIMGVINNEEC